MAEALFGGTALTLQNSALVFYTVCLFFVCPVMNFSAAEKDRGVKFCVLVRLLSGQVFSHFGELWLARSHGGALLPR